LDVAQDVTDDGGGMAKTINWTACDVELGDLKPWDRNPKSISKNHARRLIEYWQRIGQFQTIAIGPGGEVYDGHQRLSCLLSVYGASYVVKCLRASRPLTDEERQELVIAAHVGTTGQFDWDALSGWDAGQLQEWGMDAETLASWNSDANALREMLEAAKEEPPEDPGAQIDKAEELREKWGVETGQLWQLGEHRLICGDCTDKAVVDRVMGGERADLCFTSPPYNGNTTMYDYIIVDGKKKRKDKTLYEDNETDNKTSEEYVAFLHSVLDLCFQFVNGYIFWNINYNAKSRFEYIESIYPYRHNLEETIVWKKNAIPTANGFTRNFEFIFMLKTDEELGHLNKEYDVVHTIWDVNNSGSQQDTHKACFPVELPEKAIGISDKTKLVYDPFLGSGTTLIACERLGRKCRAIEISPAYCAVAIQRWVDMTGGVPELIYNGETT